MSGPRRWRSTSETETRTLGRALAAELGSDGVLLLEGDLGAGKTVLVKGLAEALGIDPAVIQSPTYTLIHEHEGSGGRLIHVDLYRLEGPEVDRIGLDDLLAEPAVKAIEWAERLSWTPPGALRLRVGRDAGGGRTVVQL
ncbi:MAG: tRNA (adenosine(37)-N6)-threonylcarbamoyltransferase complex ATPase subunit type 1 TsaE [Acidobacteria bacterium]|nr:tRNA (adenosine(37)-N6)-threonylcarbamoyltransferase complex ATPase subunit type 1 TsaE [Acidobacteriota bacterium]